MTGRVTKTKVSGKVKTLFVDFGKGNETTLKIAANPPEGHEIDVGDTVDVHIHNGVNVGVARHPPKKGNPRK